MISILIATRNRPVSLSACIASIRRSSEKHVEILVGDQSQNDLTAQRIRKIRDSRIRYFPLVSTGKSRSLNSLIGHANGNIIAFTDDDCIVSPSWIREIARSFKIHPEVSCVTGNIFPRGNTPAWACPPTLKKGATIVDTPVYHSLVGFGNNMAIRRDVLQEIGVFRTWLGPGSVATNCEDGEMIIRMLTRGYGIYHNPKMVVYHDKNLNARELEKQNLSYFCGEMACYGYYSLLGYGFAKTVIRDNFAETKKDMKKLCLSSTGKSGNHSAGWKYPFEKAFMRLRGYLIGSVGFTCDTVSGHNRRI